MTEGGAKEEGERGEGKSMSGRDVRGKDADIECVTSHWIKYVLYYTNAAALLLDLDIR
jgi:hypothetical protein